MKHTPGPWQHYNRLVSKKISNHALSIAECHGRIEEAEVNARLIAAAPDLLFACRYVVNWHRENDSGEGELFSHDFVLTCINAIQKATE